MEPQEWSDSLTHTSEQFWRMKLTDTSVSHSHKSCQVSAFEKVNDRRWILVKFLPLKCVFQIYPVTKEAYKNRMALLITNIKFTDANYNRNGAEKDQENMEQLLSALGYEVVKYTNLTGKVFC